LPEACLPAGGLPAEGLPAEGLPAGGRPATTTSSEVYVNARLFEAVKLVSAGRTETNTVSRFLECIPTETDVSLADFFRPRHAAIASFLYTATMFLAGASGASEVPERTLLATPPRALTDFELTNHEGKPMRLSQLKGAPTLVFFGFAHCPTVCPAALQELRQLEAKHPTELGATRIVIISVDGERDTPQAMAAWLKPISKKFLGLTGSPAKVREIAREFSAAFYKTPGAKPDEYLVEHNAQIFLIDAQGRLRATFFNAPVPTMAQVTKSVRESASGP
jgi:protein SCO1/2